MQTDESNSSESCYGQLKKSMRGSAPRSGRKVANCCATTWGSLVNCVSNFFNWIAENVCCCFLDDIDSESDKASKQLNQTKAQSKQRQGQKGLIMNESITKTTRSSITSTLKEQQQQQQQQQQHPSEQLAKQLDQVNTNSTSTAVAAAKQADPQQQATATSPPPLPPITATNTITTTTTSTTTTTNQTAAKHSNQQTTNKDAFSNDTAKVVQAPVPNNQTSSTINKQQQLEPAAHKNVEPPKIDFVETGSIFGDRKRHATPNLLLLEDGRFKSPGQPLITQGPGGRTIRMSFRTGFPNLRSLEARLNANQAQVSKSIDSVGTIGSNDSKKIKKKSKQNKSGKSGKTSKSLKSYISRGGGSKEVPPETNEANENESDETNDVGTNNK